MDVVSVYVTCPDVESARRIARVAIESRAAACANLVQSQSLYAWEGRLVDEPEVVMFLKTRKDAVPRLMDLVRRLHPHEVPCIVVLPIEDAYMPYRAWVAANASPD